jgi:hypothetical protein
MEAYKDIFGAPNTGLHSYRIFNIAVIDLAFTVLAAYLISKYSKQSFSCVLLVLFLSGIVLHRLFGVDTTVDRLLFE